MNTPPRCDQCAHYRREATAYPPMCAVGPFLRATSYQRHDLSICGPEGKHYKPKEQRDAP